MDTSTIIGIVISLFSVAISILFAITGFRLSNRSDQTLASIQTKIDAQNNNFMTMIQNFMTMVHEERKAHDTYNDASNERYMQRMMQMTEMSLKYIVESHKSELPKEEAESLEKQLNEVFRLQKQYDSTSVLSKKSKVEEKKPHG